MRDKMTAKNACESVVYNPQLFGRVKNLVRLYYKLAKDIFKDAGWDLEDVSQELMLRLCEDKPINNDSHCMRRCRDRLKNIIRDVYTSAHPLDGNGNRLPGVMAENFGDIESSELVGCE